MPKKKKTKFDECPLFLSTDKCYDELIFYRPKQFQVASGQPNAKYLLAQSMSSPTCLTQSTNSKVGPLGFVMMVLSQRNMLMKSYGSCSKKQKR